MIKYLEKNFDEEIQNKKILVDFYADWCGPCKMIGKCLEEIEKKINIDILKINVDKFPEVAKKFGIMSIPTIYLMENGAVIKSHTGYLTDKELIDFIEK